MYNFKDIEEVVAKRWKAQEKDIKASLQHDPKKKLFSFLEGPPTANAPPGLHHVEMRVFKDLFCRFKYMQGFSVPRQGGWDCHGLPVEVQVEKRLGLNSKKDIVKYGVAKFVKECRDSVFEYLKAWNKLTEKMAYWVDLENPYITLENNYIESVWWSLKELYEKGLLYESHKVVPLCPRCETPLSSHEVALGYKDVSEPSVVVKFKLKDSKRNILAWTTTPWTLISNVGLAVHEKLTYVVIEQEGEEYILAKDLANKYFDSPSIKEEIKGKDLKGLAYEPLFPYFTDKLDKSAWKVVLADFVTTDEGTGVVHVAGAFGEEDYEVCKENGLAFLQPVKEDGHFTDEVTEFKGMFVKDADPKIIEWLENQHVLFKKENYMHSYPFCWRCSTPLIYYATLSWFVKVTEEKDELIKHNDSIDWTPKHIQEGRFGKWLENVKDWALSRKKFWGTPLPIWRCECKHELAIGSIAELKEKATKEIKDIDLHKPHVDEVLIKCEKCQKDMCRVPDVIDCWYDSGAAQFAQFHYPFENKELFEKRHPYDFIAEALDQTRGWFYTLHVLGILIFKDKAYKSVVCGGLLVDEKGEKMSKSKGNIVDPWEMFDTVGVDAVRLQFCATEPGDTKRFGVHMINQSIMPFLKILWNSYIFAKQTKLSDKRPEKIELEDAWLLSRTNSLIKEVTEEMEKHNYHRVTSAITHFVNEDFSRWYIKLIRDRANQNDERLGYIFGYVFERVLKLLAPFAPYVTDYIYHDLFNKEKSVHFESWPKQEATVQELEESMQTTKEVVTLILSQREKAQLGVRWPLPKVVITAKEEQTIRAVKKLADLIKLQTNIKLIETKQENIEEQFFIELDTKLTPVLETEGFAREVTRKVQALRKKAGLQKQDRISLVIAAEHDISSFAEDIQQKVGAKDLKLLEIGDKDLRGEYTAEEKIKGKAFHIALNVN